jgi:toxin YoeB
MNISFTPQACEDYQFWQKNDNRILKRIHLLIQVIQRSPFEGVGKPEALKHHLS